MPAAVSKLQPTRAAKLAPGAVNTGTPEMYKKLDECKWDMLNEWAKTKRAPKHAAWMHEKEFN